MARVFISHSIRDGEAASRIKQWLLDPGFEAPFLDFDKHSGIPPGANWEQVLYRELGSSQAVLPVIVGGDDGWLAGGDGDMASGGVAVANLAMR